MNIRTSRRRKNPEGRQLRGGNPAPQGAVSLLESVVYRVHRQCRRPYVDGMNEATPTIEASGMDSMTTAPTTGPSGTDTPAQSRFLLQGGAAGAAVATIVNAALWAGGRAADVSFSVSPPLADTTIRVGVVLVVLTSAAHVRHRLRPARAGLPAFPPVGARRPCRSRPTRRGLGGWRPPAGRRRPRDRRAAGGDAPGHRRRIPGDRVHGGCQTSSFTENEFLTHN